MTASQKLYKVLDLDGTPYHGGTGEWHLPRGGRPGRWMPEITGLIPCNRGYHVVTRDQLVRWLGPAIYEVECRGEHDESQPDKIVVGQARLIRRLETWNERTQRLFAADCAAHVLPAFERRYPDNPAPRNAIRVARAFARGEATEEELNAAADAAADATAAAYAGARAAAYAAAGAARVSEWEWQTRRLWKYLDGVRK